MTIATRTSERRLGWGLAFGAILLLSIPLDQWTGIPRWLADGWAFLASNQAIFAILLAAAVLLRVFVFDRVVSEEATSPEDPLALSRADRRLLAAVLQVPTDLPLLRWLGWGLLGVAGLLGFRWLRALMTLNEASEFRTLVGEMFWVAILVATAWLAIRLMTLVRRLHATIVDLLRAERDRPS